MGFYDVVFTQVVYTLYKVQFVVAQRYYGVVVEQQSLRSFFGSGYFGYDSFDYEGVNDVVYDGLRYYYEDGYRVFFCYVAQFVVNGGLRFDGEEEGCYEVMDLYYVGRAVVVFRRFQVIMGYSNDLEDDVEQQLGGEEGQRKDEQYIALADVYVGGEYVSQVAL